jgi:hypothetical protein
MGNQALTTKQQTDIVREGAFDLTPHSLGEAIQLAELMSKSELVPMQFRNKPGDILIAVQYGSEIGLKPLQAMQGIAVINGRPTVWGDSALAVVLNSGLMENYKEMTLEEIEAAGKAVFWAKRKGTAEPIIREFSIEDAKKAKLFGKQGPWQQYPNRMLQMRARAWGLRDGFSDALKGMSVREEVEDYIVTEAPKVLAMPRRMSERSEAHPEPEQTQEQDQPPLDTAELDRIDAAEAQTVEGPQVCGKCGSHTSFHADGKYGPWWSCSSWHETKCDWKVSEKKWKQDQGLT